MTAKQRHLGTFLREKVDRLAWAANMDHWFNVNTEKGTIPEKYRGWLLHDIQRDLGSGIWQRVGLVHGTQENVKTSSVQRNGSEEVFYETPVGTVSEKFTIAPDSASTRFRTEWMIKKPEDFRVVRYMVESMEFVPNTEAFLEWERKVGEDGIVLGGGGGDPIMPIRHSLGLTAFAFALQDYPREMDALFRAYGRKAICSVKVAVQTPSLIVLVGGNIEAQAVGPSLYEKYALPVFQEMGKIIHAAGKLQQYHFDGFVKPLIPLINESQIDLIEGFTPLPVGDVTTEEFLAALDDAIVVQGGIPATLLCHGATDEEFAAFVEDTIRVGLVTRRLVLGLGDNTPPDGQLHRVQMVGRLVEEKGWWKRN